LWQKTLNTDIGNPVFFKTRGKSFLKIKFLPFRENKELKNG